MKKWNYTVSTNTIWTSFDFGTVEAETQEQARTKAIEQLKYDFNKVNDVLRYSDNTSGFEIFFDETQVEVTEEK
jgi:hypothetical protein